MPGKNRFVYFVRRLFLSATFVSVLAWGAAQAALVPSTQVTKQAKLAQPVSWGSPHQPYGKRRAVTPADRMAIQKYRSGKVPPLYVTNFTNPVELQRDWNFVWDEAQWGDPSGISGRGRG